MMDSVEKFQSYLEELDRSYTRLEELLRQKVTAVSNYNLARLEEIMKEEQVYVLLSKGFDTNLQTHRERLGVEGDTLGEVIEALPQEYREPLRAIHKRLKTTLNGVKALNQKCQELIEGRLHDLDRSIRELDKSENATYQKTGDSDPGKKSGAGLFTKSV